MSTDNKTERSTLGKEQQALPPWLDFVREQVDALKFGTVEITVHDGRVVQVEKAEKVRL